MWENAISFCSPNQNQNPNQLTSKVTSIIECKKLKQNKTKNKKPKTWTI